MAESGGRQGLWRALQAAAAGAAACGLLWLVFPGESLSTLSHGWLHLPGPGSAVAVIYGPYVVLTCLAVRSLLRAGWTSAAAGAAFAFLHGTCTPLVLGPVKTVGTVGPWPLRVLAVLLAVAALQAVLLAFRKRPAVLSHPAAATAANLTMMGCYWLAIYPAGGGRMVKPMAAVVLAGAGTLAAMLLGGLLPALWARNRHDAGEPG